MYRIAPIIFVALLFVSVLTQASSCYPKPNPARPQYIVGYGSFMNAKSTRHTDSSAGPNLPVKLKGFERAWIVGSPETDNGARYLGVRYLGVEPESNNEMNAVVFRLSSIDSLYRFDQRESAYCRVPVSAESMRFLVGPRIRSGQFWIYIPKPSFVKSDHDNARISQAYMDVFLSGCLAVEKKYQLEGFSQRCVTTTNGWALGWTHDRKTKQRVYMNDADAKQVNQLLKKMLPASFQKSR